MKILKFSLTLFIFVLSLTISSLASTKKIPSRQFYQLVVYHLKSKEQVERTNQYLRDAYLPAVHRAGIKTAGVFKNENIDTATDKKIYVLLTFVSLNQFQQLTQSLNKDHELAAKGSSFLNAAFDHAPFTRKETILMEAFPAMPVLKKPGFTNPQSHRIYELRSYEGPTENLYRNKVHMFNEGKETDIFKRIGSQAVFYAEVLAGSRMPNLMYMTSYSDMKSREDHWKTFGNDPEWKRLSGLPEYQHNVSKADIDFLTPTDYSDL
ncbi:NIPSNAP family protein [Pedobacter sp. L105]|uniref:NIPSNAP family protein n=1 Tax=Pedobacter sp. L105 TaxID=1641871 RepID=UPI00131EC729|nr:NIPSNAP family protein [Pedobacter sp. L105]